jgi:hypothetical protein
VSLGRIEQRGNRLAGFGFGDGGGGRRVTGVPLGTRQPGAGAPAKTVTPAQRRGRRDR